VAVEPVDRVLADDHGHEGGVVASDQRAVAAFWVSLHQHLVPCVEGG
jgi:hypothetical protein